MHVWYRRTISCETYLAVANAYMMHCLVRGVPSRVSPRCSVRHRRRLLRHPSVWASLWRSHGRQAAPPGGGRACRPGLPRLPPGDRSTPGCCWQHCTRGGGENYRSKRRSYTIDWLIQITQKVSNRLKLCTTCTKKLNGETKKLKYVKKCWWQKSQQLIHY